LFVDVLATAAALFGMTVCQVLLWWQTVSKKSKMLVISWMMTAELANVRPILTLSL